ncbi:CDK5 [Bugula neritina]|uniref:CDK5 n=1 Tax=Bugula neritina TaxID=10212 RepID=A0A7J7KSQ6_BUGNE|nr:CDK5 [Bugula neritina]
MCGQQPVYFAELSNSGKPLFPGTDINDQLKIIFRLLGVPTESSWSGVTQLPDYKAYTQFPVALTWDQSVPNLDHFGKDLLQKI